MLYCDKYMKFERLAKQKVLSSLQPGKVVMLYGPRQVGKTTILKEIAAEWSGTCKFVNAEETIIAKYFAENSVASIQSFIGQNKLIIIDEAQSIPEIGRRLKLMVDHFPNLMVIASGSASFSLAQQVGEPLVGRQKVVSMFPVCAQEIVASRDQVLYRDALEQFLLYGSYPELINLPGVDEKRQYLTTIVDGYLFRDILALQDVRNAKKMRDLLTLIAYQIGKEVSHNELANALGLNAATVFRYLDLLEKSFVIINIRGFSRNLRKEVTKTGRYYFYDNGIRNAIVNNFNTLSLRNDVGELWENYLVMERLKKQSYQDLYSNNYFWRTYDHQEVDFVEERDGKLYGFEFKWGDKKVKPPKDWTGTYDNASFTVINRDNFLEFVL